jgi:hypothetical protein
MSETEQSMADHGQGHGQGHGHETAQDHTSGTMDIRDKEKTFEGFIRMTVWGAGIAVAILIFMALANS